MLIIVFKISTKSVTLIVYVFVRDVLEYLTVLFYAHVLLWQS